MLSGISIEMSLGAYKEIELLDIAPTGRHELVHRHRNTNGGW
jgi:hypothetical protein